jgi:C4-dicarboxylate transporter
VRAIYGIISFVVDVREKSIQQSQPSDNRWKRSVPLLYALARIFGVIAISAQVFEFVLQELSILSPLLHQIVVNIIVFGAVIACYFEARKGNQIKDRWKQVITFTSIFGLLANIVLLVKLAASF